MSSIPLPAETPVPLTGSPTSPSFIGEGTYHAVYRNGPRVEKHTKKGAFFNPERSVRLCRVVSPDLHPTEDDPRTWSMDFFAGQQANDMETVMEVLRIYRATGRVMVDALVSGNVLSKDGEVKAVDMDCILTRRGSDASDLILGTPERDTRYLVYSQLQESYKRAAAEYPRTFYAIFYLYYHTFVVADLTKETSPEEIETILKSYFEAVASHSPVLAFQLVLRVKPKDDATTFSASLMAKAIEHFYKEDFWTRILALAPDQKTILRECVRQLLCKWPSVLRDKGNYSAEAKDRYRHGVMFLIFASMKVSMGLDVISDEGELTRRLLRFFSTPEFQEKGKYNLYRLSMYRVLLTMLGVESDHFSRVEGQAIASIFLDLCENVLCAIDPTKKELYSQRLPYGLDLASIEVLCAFIQGKIESVSIEERPLLKEKIDKELLSQFFISKAVAERLVSLWEEPVVSPISLAFGDRLFGKARPPSREGGAEDDNDSSSESVAWGSP
jgi:hypothetical protein